MSRYPVMTYCPDCDTATERSVRHQSTRIHHWCDDCKRKDDYNSFRQFFYRYGQNRAVYDRLMSIEFCQCCDRKLVDGKGPGHGAINKRQIDHCHTTGKIRGVLCWDCNVGIGKLGDTIEGVCRALEYLDKD